MEELTAISPLDGRYYGKLKELSEYFSEYALIKKRLFVEILYLKELGKGDFSKVFDDFDTSEAQKVKDIEKTTNHDVKAVEYYLKENVPENIKEYVHYGLTSEDINNLAYSLLIKEFIEEIYNVKIGELLKSLEFFSQKYKELPMLARTHGQPASPTTIGKEFFVFYSRLKDEFSKFERITLKGKLNGATGNYNALAFAEPKRDWISFSRSFVLKIGLTPNLVTTQVEPKDTLVELFQCIKRINNIVLDIDRDMWLYIAYDYMILQKKDSEVGSSTMPHKVNPIDFENSEGNIRIANSLFTGFEDLQISRMQRDLSDSTITRNIGVAFAHSMLAYDSLLKGLGKIMPNKVKLQTELDSHPEVLTEAIQTYLRKLGKNNSYELLKDLARGKAITLEQIHELIDSLDISEKDKTRLKNLRVDEYIGLAKEIVQ
jgi:adenylosuccinate lyase